jgi:hypothetical protein
LAQYRLLLLVLALLLGPWAVFQPQAAYALPKRDPRPPGECEPDWHVQGGLVLNGLYLGDRVLRTQPIIINASSMKVSGIRNNCTPWLYPMPLGDIEWELVSRPAGSNASLANTNTLMVSLTPDVLGAYTVRFTGCSRGCSSLPVFAEPASFTLTINAVNSFVLPPATAPALPPQTPATEPSVIPEADEKCLGGGGVADPQWVTVNQWTGANDYELLEGIAVKSRISRKDNPLNHDSQDHLVHVLPDPMFRRLLRGTQSVIETEWERNHLPEPFRATPGDRVSAFGYWILDCAHDAPTEIHPPIGVAVQRPRAVAIPGDKLFPLPVDDGDGGFRIVQERVGTNVFVPGIVTDIWFNRQSGEITNNCSTTGLHQPGRFVDTPQGRIKVQGACIRSPAPLDRVFNFRIYLPPRPRLDWGIEVPIYFETFNHPHGFSDGPAPKITLAGTEAVPYLDVSIDMRGFSGSRYARQIRAGWVIPSPTNWGLQQWRLRLTAVDVHDDGDSFARGDGDWRFWLNTNNGMQEWTKLFDCDGCVHGRENFGGRPWQTSAPGDVSPDRTLGPDILRFPGQRIWVHSSGFEADGLIDDDTGSVNDLRPQAAARYRTRSSCTEQTVSGCASYTLEYEIQEGPALSAPTLTAAGRFLHNSYFVQATDPTPPCPACAETVASWHPADTTLKPDDPPVELSKTLLFRSQPSVERHALTDITLPDFTATIEQTRGRGTDATDRLMRDLRAVVDEQLASPLVGEVRDDLATMIGAIPADLRQQYFGDLKLYSLALPLISR